MQDNFETRDDRSTNRDSNPIQPHRRRRRKKKDTAKILWTTAVVVLALILVVLIGVAVVVDMLNHLDRPVGPQDSTPGSTTGLEDDTEPSGPPMPSTSVPPLAADAVINVMLLGVDEEGYRTDTMILCTVNVAKKTVTLTSFMRDLWVYIPAKEGSAKLNSAWGRGQFQSLSDTLKHNFGLQVDDYFLVNFDNFKAVIDIIGGVDIELSQKEVDYFKEVTYYGDGLEVGMNHLNGEQALCYARMRKPDGDFQRTDRQRKVLEAIFEAYKGKGLAALSLMDDILPYISTNMENKEILTMAWQMLPMLSGFRIEKKGIPAPQYLYQSPTGLPMYTEEKVNGQQVLIPNLDVVREYLDKILNP